MDRDEYSLREEAGGQGWEVWLTVWIVAIGCSILISYDSSTRSHRLSVMINLYR